MSPDDEFLSFILTGDYPFPDYGTPVEPFRAPEGPDYWKPQRPVIDLNGNPVDLSSTNTWNTPLAEGYYYTDPNTGEPRPRDPLNDPPVTTWASARVAPPDPFVDSVFPDLPPPVLPPIQRMQPMEEDPLDAFFYQIPPSWLAPAPVYGDTLQRYSPLPVPPPSPFRR